MSATRDRTIERPWSVPVRVHEIPESGRHFELKADGPARALIARLADLRSLPRLEASFDVTRQGANGVRVVGQVSATVGQICVVTLDPIENEITEAVDLVFEPQAPSDPGGTPGRAGLVDIPSVDAPEPLVNDTVDLGVMAMEFMILGIDPYPRKPGAVFQAPSTGDEAAHPFAALAKLRGGRGGEGS
jgi:hypothetical protein